MASMMFWGVEVKAGEPLKVTLEDDFILHLSQAALGESKKGKTESATLSVTVDGKKLVLGTLSAENIPQMQFDLVFEKEFELSHNWKSGSVFFTGYKSVLPDDDFAVATEEFSEFESEDEEDIPMTGVDNGRVEKAKPAPAKAAAAKPEAPKMKVKQVVPAKPPTPESGDDDSEDSDGEDDDEDGSSEDESGEEMSGDDSEDEDDSEEEEETPTPKKPESGKKRANGSAQKTPVPNKKAKASATTTPQKTDGKKAGHTDTPHPAKKDGKSAAKTQTPKSAGSVTCKSCDRTFGSDAAMQSHAKAKHSAAK